MLISAFPRDEEGFQCFLEETGDSRRCRLIDNKVSSRSKVKGYCASSHHPGYLTEKQIKQHQCIEKECKYLYYIKQENKERNFPIEIEIEDISEKVVKKANEAIKPYEGIRIIKAEYNSKDLWNLYYAAIASYNMKTITDVIKKKLNTNIKLHKMSLDFETSSKLVFENK